MYDMKRLLIIPLLFLGIMAYAQDSNGEKAERIKADNAYVTGDGFGPTLEEASGNATRNLLSKITTSLRSSLDGKTT